MGARHRFRATVVLAVGAAEIVLRAVRPAFLRHSRVEHPHVYSEAYGWALRPGARYTGRGGETITVNARGYRGPPHAGRPAPGRHARGHARRLDHLRHRRRRRRDVLAPPGRPAATSRS